MNVILNGGQVQQSWSADMCPV